MFSFTLLEETHLSLFRHWLKQEHIKGHWQETDDDQKLREKFLIEMPKRGVHPFIVRHEGQDIGYIQYYDATKVGGGWWPEEPAGTFGVDLMIGDANFLGKGLGPLIIQAFVEFVKGREKGIQSLIIDPDPENRKAVRAFEKAGFRREKEIITPGGRALLMRMKP